MNTKIKTLIIMSMISFFMPLTLFAANTSHLKMHAPKLAAEYPDILTWTWHHKNPYRWNLYSILGGGTICVLVSDYWKYGYDRRFSPDGGSEPVFVVGVDQSGKEITGRSNVVRPDDAPVPGSKPPRHKIALSYDYGACGNGK